VHNKLLTYQDKRYRYDAFGRMIEKRSAKRGVQRFAYDAESRLVEVRNDDGSVVRMTYDPLGRRVEKTEHGSDGYPLGETWFTWDGLRLLQEHKHSQTSLYIYQDEGYEPLARVDGSGPLQKIRYYHNDLNGLPEQLTEADGHNVWQATYRVWGNTLEEVREPYYIEEQNLRFQGQYLDRETGLHFNTFRFYDPDVGRFTTPDPISLQGGLNLYLYGENPFTSLDPLGWAPTPLNKPGFYVYGLYAPNAKTPYYIGHTEQIPSVREGQHARTTRLGNGELRVLKGQDGKMTYSQAKGYEQAYREKYKTKGKFPNNVIEPINKSRTDSRGKAHYKNYRAAAKALGIKPSKVKSCT
jgi:RHS repeat-associated protein